MGENFMARNRRTNGAADPAQTAKSQASEQNKQRRLSTNPPVEQQESLLFTPDMSSPAAINEAHYLGGLNGNGPYGRSYEDKIPYIGKNGSDATAPGTQKLKDR